LLAAQWLALVHGIGHRGVGAAPLDGAQAPVAALAQGLLKVVTGHDEKSPACQLFDQLAQASPLGAALPALAVDAQPEAPPQAELPQVAAASPRHYHARAPPVLA
jgi:hypothetical protein